MYKRSLAFSQGRWISRRGGGHEKITSNDNLTSVALQQIFVSSRCVEIHYFVGIMLTHAHMKKPVDGRNLASSPLEILHHVHDIL